MAAAKRFTQADLDAEFRRGYQVSQLEFDRENLKRDSARELADLEQRLAALVGPPTEVSSSATRAPARKGAKARRVKPNGAPKPNGQTRPPSTADAALALHIVEHLHASSLSTSTVAEIAEVLKADEAKVKKLCAKLAAEKKIQVAVRGGGGGPSRYASLEYVKDRGPTPLPAANGASESAEASS